MLVKNAADPEQVEAGQIKQKYGRDRDIQDLRIILGTHGGRRFVWRYLNLCKVFESTWSPSAAIHFNEGQRDIGLKLMEDIREADDEALIRMMREAKDEEKKQKGE